MFCFVSLKKKKSLGKLERLYKVKNFFKNDLLLSWLLLFVMSCCRLVLYFLENQLHTSYMDTS